MEVPVVTQGLHTIVFTESRHPISLRSCGFCIVNKAEMLTLRTGLRVSPCLNISNLLVEGDLACVIEWASDRCKSPWMIQPRIRERVWNECGQTPRGNLLKLGRIQARTNSTDGGWPNSFQNSTYTNTLTLKNNQRKNHNRYIIE